MKNTKLLISSLLIFGLASGFGAGYFFRNSQLPKSRGNFTVINGKNGGMRQGLEKIGTTIVQGEIISQDDKSITVKLTDGSTKIIILADSTSYSEEKTVEKNNLIVGTKVGIFGTPNSDGSITAQSVRLPSN